MLKVLLQKQLTEIFRGYFLDQRKNKARSTAATIVLIILFAFVMIAFIGGMFTSTAVMLCGPLAEAGMSWLYFCIMGMLAIFLGAFGGVFSTYSGLYLAKDNELLLAMPIPVRVILASRLLSVYLLGTMYSAVVAVPAVAVYCVFVQHDALTILSGVIWVLMITAIVMVLCCALGWCVAKISLKLKNKSYITVLISLALLGAYYFFYFKAQILIRALIANAAEYGARIRGKAYVLYYFGSAGQGKAVPLLVCCAVTAVLLVLTYLVLSRTFLRIATATAAASKKKYREKAVRGQSASSALLRKEFARFTTNPNYMLNCGLGVLMLPAAGIVLLVKGNLLADTFAEVFAELPGVLPVLAFAVVCFMASMSDMAAPSVSLEGKSIWIVQSLPVTAWQVLRAKLMLQLLLSGVPSLFFLLCTAYLMPGKLAAWVSVLFASVAVVFFASLLDLYCGVRLANLTWTNELSPIKQSASVMIAIFGMWAYAVVTVGPYFLLGTVVPAPVYLCIVGVVTALFDLLLYRRLRTKGVAAFMALSA